MATKQIANSGVAPDGSAYVTFTDGAGNLLPNQSSGFPSGATPITASATGTTGVTTATLAATSGKTTYIAGFSIGAVATTAINGAATVTGTVTGTMSFLQGVGAAPAVVTTRNDFHPAIPASATNTAIAVNSIAAGTAGVTNVSAWGYQL